MSNFDAVDYITRIMLLINLFELEFRAKAKY